MGKKRIIQKSEEETLKEKEKIEQKMKKEFKIKTPEHLKRGRICVSSSYNNTKIGLTDEKGNVLLWRSAGSVGFKGTKKGTSYAGSQVAKAIAEAAFKMGISELDVFIKGIGGGRDSALRTLAGQGLNIVSIKDITPIPHNGCRPRKPRRV